MQRMKHFAEAVGRSTSGRLDKVTKRATVKSVRVKIRTFMSQWQRQTHLNIPKEVHDSMAPVSAPASLPTPRYQPMMCLLTREKVHQRHAQIQDSSVDRRKGTHVLNDSELRRHGGATLAE
jgi:hypothetical protein